MLWEQELWIHRTSWQMKGLQSLVMVFSLDTPLHFSSRSKPENMFLLMLFLLLISLISTTACLQKYFSVSCNLHCRASITEAIRCAVLWETYFSR